MMQLIFRVLTKSPGADMKVNY